ncbi:substrate-binding domain-containing protein [Sphingomonas qomolangmaensis]|uniref:Substrate-binding domain-containing protein n=1 Tax=Sphingomonas qomolangmaensis TaxID=2918765 RepID=A0ABY5LAC0_9SPHN|nr:substrate-binding domain-containing protein [Sphingomonas qomolangmaensis]UUL82988.1 substrate-binding domain-containing protein [Sphingomonas qomolangmaensis]
MLRIVAIASLSALALAACSDSRAARDEIRVVGSSTVYPFTTAVAEQFNNARPDMKSPVIESTGTGAGIKQFCAGIGPQYPDMLNASRRLYRSEYDSCQANGVREILEIQVGIDGIALAESLNGPGLSFTLADIYRAVAANPGGKPNTARLWSEVNPAFPAIPIQVLGPPSTSGTRDAFVELILEPGCKAAVPEAEALEDSDEEAYNAMCTRMRNDSAYVDKGENDNLIVQNLVTNPNAVGIFGFSYLEENAGRLKGSALNGIEPTYETISSGAYPGARPLYLYVKKQHIRPIPGLQSFLDDYVAAWGPDGPLVRKGMIAAPREIRERSAEIVRRGIALDPAVLK